MRSSLIIILLGVATTSFSQSLRVGVYHNPPLVIADSSNQPSGFTVELLNEIAKSNEWQVAYKTFSFSDCLEALNRGEIDIMPALAYSLARDSLYRLNETSVVSNWAKLFKRESDKSAYTSVEQLRGSKIGVVKDDYYARNGDDGLLDLLNELDILAEVVEYTSYDAVADALKMNDIDLGLLSRYYGTFNTEGKNIVKTPINVAYVSVRFGFNNQPKNGEFVEKLDASLLELIGNRNSVYYDLEKEYLAYKGQEFIPQWLWQTFTIVMGGLATLGIFTILLQYQVKRKTSELKLTNRELLKSQHQERLALQTIQASQDIGFWFRPGQTFISVNKAACQLTGYSEEELLNMVPRDLLVDDRNSSYYDALRSGEWEGHLLLEDKFRRKDGSTYPVEISLDEVILDGELFICGFARDISARVKAEYELLEKNKELSCLYAISQLVANRKNTKESIFQNAVRVIPIAWQYPELTIVKIEVDGKVFQTENYTETPWKLFEDILVGEEIVGRLTVGYLKQIGAVKNPFLVEENNLIKAIANEFSNLITSRDSEKRIMATILNTEDKERSRISKELHDSVGQTLSAISLHLSSLSTNPELDPEQRERVKEIEVLVNSAIGESRSVSHNLMPPALIDLGLTYAVENILENIESVSPTKFIFQTNASEKRQANEIEVAVFRIVQEAVNNIIKYAEASEATIQYLVYDNEISLSIEDNGSGFDMKVAEKKHNFGLNSMRNRALSVGGDIDISTSPGKGTNININIPLNSAS